MITKKSVREDQLGTLLRKMLQTPEGAEVERFLEEDPDVELTFTGLMMRIYEYHTNSVRTRRRKEAKELGLDSPPQSKSKPKPSLKDLGLDPPIEQTASSAAVAEVTDLMQRIKRGEPRNPDLAVLILNSGWDLERNSKRFTPDEDRGFLEDMANAKDDGVAINENHKLRLKITGQDYIKWLNRKPKADPTGTNGASNGGA